MLQPNQHGSTVIDSLPASAARSNQTEQIGQPKTSRSGMLIINADDWGRDRENTDKTIDCLDHRTISSVSAMVFMQDSGRAAEIALEKGVDAGLHLNLTTPFTAPSIPQRLREEQARLVRYLGWHRFGHLVFHPGLTKSFAYVVAAQLEEFQRLYGHAPARIDGHHHAHLCANVVRGKLLPEGSVVRRNFSFAQGEKSFANRTYRGWLDRQLARRHRLVDYFFSIEPLDRDRLRAIFSLARKAVIEIETHPVSSEEYSFLQSEELFELCCETHIAPCSLGTVTPQNPTGTKARLQWDHERTSPSSTLTGENGRSRARVVSERRDTTVVVGFAEALAAPEVIWSLTEAGFNVIAFARKGRNCALRSSNRVQCFDICAPEVDIKAAMSDLLSLLGTHQIVGQGAPPILFPLDDKAVFLCNQAAKNSDCLSAGPQGIHADLALDKHLQILNALKAGFNVPKTILAREAQQIREFAAREGFPVILKSAHCVPMAGERIKSTNNWICANDTELEAALKIWNGAVPLLVQSYVPGTGEGIFGLAAAEGVRAWSGHRRLRMMNPHGSGSSACISQMVSQDVRDKADAFIRQTGWQGLFMIELLRDAEGKIFFIEFNGRPWGSMALSRRQQLEYPAWHMMLALDPSSDAAMHSFPQAGIISRNMGRELLHLLFVLRGPGSSALQQWPSAWRSLLDVVRFRRTDTFYNWNLQDRKVFFADVYHTLRSNLLKSAN